MRITNKIMQNNALSNINLAKVTEDARGSELSSGKKIVRPSDDPIIAIRALRLRSSVVELTQYYSRNAKDAEAWLKTTEDAIQQVSDVVTALITQYNKGANEYLTSEERNIILEQLKSLKHEVYATGDADYAGRYVFTGYRTETPLMFREDTDKTYRITEQLMASDLLTNTFVKTSYRDDVKNLDLDLTDLKEGSQSEYSNVNENEISKETYYRIRLSYNNCDDAIDNTTATPKGPDNSAKMPVIEFRNVEGVQVRIDGNGRTNDGTPATKNKDEDNNVLENAVRCVKSTAVPSPYTSVGVDEAVYLYDTGELLLGKNLYNEMAAIVDDPLTGSVNEGEIKVSYEKTYFKDGDLRPEHYFYCETAGKNGTFAGKLGNEVTAETKLSDLGIGVEADGTIKEIEVKVIVGGKEKTVKLNSEGKDMTLEDAAAAFKKIGYITDIDTTTKDFQKALTALTTVGLYDDIVYNPDYLKYGKARQSISYDVGYNQRIQVNTIAEECFNPAIDREVDDMIQALEKMQKTETVVKTLKDLMEKATNVEDQKMLQKQLDAANKALTYERQVVQNKFSGGVTAMQGFLNEVNIAVTACGARGSRLDLVSSRLGSQKTTFEVLKSENEDVDLSEAVIELTSAEMTYEAALKATGKIMQTNLMDFI